MGYSGKPSRGCAPCREKRTKCDLVVPSCTQCIRKGRRCHGYRDIEDARWRPWPSPSRGNTPKDEEKSLKEEDWGLEPMPINRDAGEEAIMHFFAHWNEKFYTSHDGNSITGGFDYIRPVFNNDLLNGGPVPEVIRAIGLAALGNTQCAPHLLVQARQKQSQVLRRLNQQLQNPRIALSDSSILTCILLSLFETVICEPQSTQAMEYHLDGALTLARLRGPAQFESEIGQGIYSRVRGFMLAHCLQFRGPTPEFIKEFLDNDEVNQRDFEPFFYQLLAQLCDLRSEQKIKGFVDVSMAEEAEHLSDLLAVWQPNIPDWQPDRIPLGDPTSIYQQGDSYRIVWLAAIYLSKQTSRILALDMVIEWARAQSMLVPGGPATAKLDQAVEIQRQLGEELAMSTEYYMNYFKEAESGVRAMGGYELLWPLYVLSTSSTSTTATMLWINEKVEQVTDEFALRQGKGMVDFMKTYTTFGM